MKHVYDIYVYEICTRHMNMKYLYEIRTRNTQLMIK
jgi:hypothetical protein